MMGDLIIVFVKSPSIPVQEVLGDYIDRCIIMSISLRDLTGRLLTTTAPCI